MSSNSQKYSSKNQFVIKNKHVIVYLFITTAFFISLVFLDSYVLPASKTTDIITYYNVQMAGGKNGSKPSKISYHYYTQKGFTFSTVKNYIEENEIELEYSLLFKSIIKVKSKNHDDTSDLSNGLSINGIQF